MQKNGIVVQGVGANIGILYRMSERISVGAGARQIYSNEVDFSALYTAIDLRALFSLTGRPPPAKRRYTSDETLLAESETGNPGGLFWEVSAKQYYFNLESTVLPYAGFGTALLYEFSSNEAYSFAPGLGVDRITNQNSQLVPIRVFLEMAITI